MTDLSRRALPLGILAAVIMALPHIAPAQGVSDCALPIRPAAVTDARMRAEYAAELREEYAVYFDEAQAFFRCLEHARAVVTEEVNQAIADYGALDSMAPD